MSGSAQLEYFVRSREARWSVLAISAGVLGCAGTPTGIMGLAFWAVAVTGFEGYTLAPDWLELLWLVLGFAAYLVPPILGWISLRRIKQSAGALKGRGWALAGFWVPLLLLALHFSLWALRQRRP